MPTREDLIDDFEERLHPTIPNIIVFKYADNYEAIQRFLLILQRCKTDNNIFIVLDSGESKYSAEHAAIWAANGLSNNVFDIEDFRINGVQSLINLVKERVNAYRENPAELNRPQLLFTYDETTFLNDKGVPEPRIICFAEELLVDRLSKMVYRNGVEIKLSGTSFRLFFAFIDSLVNGKVGFVYNDKLRSSMLRRGESLEGVSLNSLQAGVSKLRQKLGIRGNKGIVIRDVHGKGYQLTYLPD